MWTQTLIWKGVKNHHYLLQSVSRCTLPAFFSCLWNLWWWGVCLWGGWVWLQGGVSKLGCRVGGIDQSRIQTEREHSFGVSQWWVGVGGCWALFQLAWQLYQGMCVTGGLGGVAHQATARKLSKSANLEDSPLSLSAVYLCFLFLLLVTTRHPAVHVCICSTRHLTESYSISFGIGTFQNNKMKLNL